MSLIPADNIFALGAILFCVAWLAFLVDTKPLGKKTSGVIWALGVSMLLSNIGIIPFSSPSYDFVGGSLVPLAIPLLLLKADLRRIFRESGGVMIFFCIACMATIAGAVIGFYIMDLGEIGPKVAGVYTGGWIGGAVNVLAVSQAVQMTSQEFSVSLSASSVVSMSALMLLIVIPSIGPIKRMVTTRADDSARVLPIESGQDQTPTLQLTHISGALALSFTICAVANWIAQWLQLTQYSILFITVLTIAVANAFPGQMSGLKGDFELGMLLMYLFFVVVGAGTDAVSFIASAFHLFVYGMLIIIIHLALVMLAARLMKVNLEEAIVASAAALVGPAATAAVATSKGWKHLVTPGIMCGVFGYVIGTFIGVTVTAALS